MTFGEKLKKLRTDKNLTQEELADAIFVTRTAISKWETDKGYPSIDSLKVLSNYFDVSIDELISNADVENKKQLENKKSKKFYATAICFLIATVVFTLLAYILEIKYLTVGSCLCMIGYVIFAILTKPKDKRLQMRKVIVPYIITRAVLFVIVVSITIYTLVTL